MILDGTLQPGDRLPAERELAEQLGVNRSSLREALKKLEQLRLIRIQQGSGIRVRKLEEASFDLVRSILRQDGEPKRAWLADLLELREALLPGVLRLALERSSAGERAALAGLLRRGADLAPGDEELLALLRQLQDELARMSRNQALMMLSHSLGQFVADPAGRAFRATPEKRTRLLPVLQRLAVALEARDAGTCDRALRDLLRRQSDAILAAVDA